VAPSNVAKPPAAEDSPKPNNPSPAAVAVPNGSTPSLEQTILQAWTMSAIPMDRGDGLGCSCRIDSLPIPQQQIKARLDRQQRRSSSVVECLEKLNPQQRSMVTDHAKRQTSDLLFVEQLQRVHLATVFGDLEVAVLMWITASSMTQSESIVIYVRACVYPFSLVLLT
jgi:hypothetical protein